MEAKISVFPFPKMIFLYKIICREAPTLVGKSPTFEGRVPTLEGKAPTFEGIAPTLEGKSPTLEGITPTSEGMYPTREGGYPIFAYHLHETKQQTNLFTAPFLCLQTQFNFIKGQEVRQPL